MTGDHRLVGVRVDAEGHAYERTLDPHSRCEARLVGRIQDHEGPVPCRFPEECLVLVVSVHDDLVAREARRECERELTRRRDIGSGALLP